MWPVGLFGFGFGPPVMFGGFGLGPPTIQIPGGFFYSQPKQLPLWLADAQQGIPYEQTFGQTKDTELDLLKQASKARWPDQYRPDAFTHQAYDRLMFRAPPEGNAQFAARLQSAPDISLWWGTSTAMVNVMAPYGYSAVNTLVAPNWAVILEGNLTWFSRFIILVNNLYWQTDGVWDSPTPGNYDDGGDWDSTVNQADVDYLRLSIRTTKSDESYPVLIGVVLNGPGDGLWDQQPADVYDAPNTFWTDTVQPYTLIGLGHIWEEEENLFGGSSGTWDAADSGLWDDGIETGLFPPSVGWSAIV